MQRLLGAELVLELVGGGGIGLVEIAAAQPVVERDVGVLDPLEVLEIGEGAGRLELVVHIDLGGCRLDLVEDRGQLLVFGGDELRPPPRQHAGSAAMTAATGSPTKRTFSSARIGWSWKAGP